MEFLGAGGVEAVGALFCEMLHQVLDGQCALLVVVIIGVEHLLEGPLSPFVVTGVAGAHLAVPVKTKTYLVELLTIALDVVDGGDGGVLAGLYGILLCRQSVSVVSHGVEHVEALLSLVTCIDVGCDVSERVSHVKACPGGVGEHVEHIEFLTVLVFGHLVGLPFNPALLPFFLDVVEIVFHIFFNRLLLGMSEICALLRNLRAKLQ